MSNCFEIEGGPAPDPERAPLIRLLQAMAQEWAAIASDVGTLGVHVARVAAEHHTAVSIRDLQSFDTIQQRAHGQAGLLAKLAAKIAAEPAFDPAHLGELLAHIPFETVRANLKAAYHGSAPAIPVDHKDAIDWF